MKFYSLVILLVIAGHKNVFCQKITRGPYLQISTPTSMQVHWRTDTPTESQVRIGTNLGQKNILTKDNTLTNEHAIKLSNLLPDTKYFYEIETSNGNFVGDSSYYFITAPTENSVKKFSVWALGDCGNRLPRQAAVKKSYENFTANQYTNLWILLGDNVYDGGDDNNFQRSFFDQYQNGKVMKQTVLYPAPGNHDYDGFAKVYDNKEMGYYKAFHVPSQGEAGGVASSSSSFYSYNYANTHFISLDSYANDINNLKIWDKLNQQALWLEKDLASNNKMWTVVYFHHPPYTKGSHDSDIESDLTAIRQTLVPIFEKYKVDLVLCGHSHSYERTKLLKGHYGLEESFDAKAHNLSTSSGKYDGSEDSCPYIKNTKNTENEGIIYVVAGSGGAYGYARNNYPHNAMYTSYLEKGGSLYLEIEDNRLDAKFINEDGLVFDQFSIMKNTENNSEISINPYQKTTLKASWIGNYKWNTQEKTQEITVRPNEVKTYTVTDNKNCLTNTFRITPKPCNLDNLKINTNNTQNLKASYECTDADGFTHYTTDDGEVLVSLKKMNINIGNINNNTLIINQLNNDGVSKIDRNHPVNYIKNNNGWMALNKRLILDGANIFPENKTIEAKFYFSEKDFNALKENQDENDFTSNSLRSFYINQSSKNNIITDPKLGHKEVTRAKSMHEPGIRLLNNANYLSDSTWLLKPLSPTVFQSSILIGKWGTLGWIAQPITKVEINKFTAQNNNKQIILTWKTIKEQNIKEFTLLKTDKRTNKTTVIATIPSVNPSSNSNKNEYTHNDNDVLFGDYLYSLWYTDWEENEKKIAETNVLNQPLSIENAQNITYEGIKNRAFDELTIYTNNGKLIYKTNKKGQFDELIFKQLNKGLNIVVISKKGKHKTFKVLK
ncbi:MAG: metallophosphoesterase [Pseudarcicella sp.]|nr:metallophosphoesterase [Pseudarcicella sp.]MBP6410220.1 metallophosphoesterase [Pseudarcicella sp.]